MCLIQKESESNLLNLWLEGAEARNSLMCCIPFEKDGYKRLDIEFNKIFAEKYHRDVCVINKILIENGHIKLDWIYKHIPNQYTKILSNSQ